MTLLRPPPARSLRSSDTLSAWLMSAPALILLLTFLIAPFLMAFGLSFTDFRLNSPLEPEFVGGRNYARLLEDESVRRALLNNVLFVLVVVPVQSVLALGMALLVNQKLPGVQLFRTLYFVPVATVMSVVAVVWSLLYNSPDGLINALVSTVTFGAVSGVEWLNNPATAFGAVMLLSIWQGAGYQMLIFLAGLQGIALELYEAASIDGATPVQQFLHVTLPQLRNTLIFVLVTTTILAFRLFDQVYVMTQGGPQDSTTTLVLQLVVQGFQGQRLAYACAISVVFFVIVLGISLLQRRLLPEERAL